MRSDELINQMEVKIKHLLATIIRPVALRDTFPFEVMLWLATLWFLKAFFFRTERVEEYITYWNLERAGWRPFMFALVIFLSIFPLWGVYSTNGIVRRIWLIGELLWWSYTGFFYQLARPENPNSIAPLLFAAIAVLCTIEQAKREVVIQRVRRLIDEDVG